MKEFKDIKLPDYNHCILNTITSILKYYNVKSDYKSLEKLDVILDKGKYRNIIFIVLDGLGEYILNSISKNGFLENNKIDCVTSVYPSTTTAALTSYYSGKPPYETGWIGWSQYFKEYGRAIDMFSHNESYLGETLKNPLKDVFTEEMSYEYIFNKIEKESPNVKTFEIEPEYAERRCKRHFIANNIDELVSAVKDISSIPGENFVFAYSDNPDGIMHKTGTDSKETKDFVLDTELKLKNLKEQIGDDSIIIISADHGHKNVDKAYKITDFPEIMECLITPPTLESRALSFWVKEDMKEIFESRFNSIFQNEFWLMTKKQFLDEFKFLGEGNKHKKIDDFIGNYIAISVSGSIIGLETFLTEGKPLKKSTHCGLSKEEMEVPVIVI